MKFAEVFVGAIKGILFDSNENDIEFSANKFFYLCKFMIFFVYVN